MEKIIGQVLGWVATLLFFAGLGAAIFSITHETKPSTSDNDLQKIDPNNFPDKFSSEQACKDAGVEGAIMTPEGDVADGYYRKCLQDGTYKIIDGAYENIQNDKAWEEYQRSNE